MKFNLRKKVFITFLSLNSHSPTIYSLQKHDLLHFLTSDIFGSEKRFDMQSSRSKFGFELFLTLTFLVSENSLDLQNARSKLGGCFDLIEI